MTRRNHSGADLLILGLGNVLCSDDGAGIAAVHQLLRDYQAAPGAVVMDGGTLGLSLLPHLQDARAAILVDAVRTDAPPGTLLRLTGSDVRRAVGYRLSPHQIGVADLLDSSDLLGQGPRELVLVGIVPESIALGLRRTPEVARHLDDLVQAVCQEARRMGFPFRRAAEAAPAPEGADDAMGDAGRRDMARALEL